MVTKANPHETTEPPVGSAAAMDGTKQVTYRVGLSCMPCALLKACDAVGSGERERKADPCRECLNCDVHEGEVLVCDIESLRKSSAEDAKHRGVFPCTGNPRPTANASSAIPPRGRQRFFKIPPLTKKLPPVGEEDPLGGVWDERVEKSGKRVEKSGDYFLARDVSFEVMKQLAKVEGHVKRCIFPYFAAT